MVLLWKSLSFEALCVLLHKRFVSKIHCRAESFLLFDSRLICCMGAFSWSLPWKKRQTACACRGHRPHIRTKLTIRSRPIHSQLETRQTKIKARSSLGLFEKWSCRGVVYSAATWKCAPLLRNRRSRSATVLNLYNYKHTGDELLRHSMNAKCWTKHFGGI